MKRVAPPAPKAARRARALRQTLFSALQTLLFTLLALILLFTFLSRIITVVGASMQPSLQEGEILLLQRVGWAPQQGDIVVLTKPFGSVDHPYVKRVMATGGQTLEIDYEAGLVYVDGQRQEEPYLGERMEALAYPRDTTYIEVPQGHVFVMGDNRNHSDDSRNVELLAVDERYILGKACFVLFPPEQFGPVKAPAAE